MFRILRPPAPLDIGPSEKSLFLAGSIDMGNAPPWQTTIEDAFRDRHIFENLDVFRERRCLPDALSDRGVYG